MYQRILLPIDGSDTCKRALQEAKKIITPTTELRLVYVLEDVYPLDTQSFTVIDYTTLQQALRETGSRALTNAANALQETGINIETALLDVAGERVAHVINEEAKNWHADLIILATHGRTGINRLLLGSVAEGVVRGAMVPVLLVRASDF